jgi:hypothetical protein
VALVGKGECGRGIVSGLRVGKEVSDVRICFVVNWKKIGSFEVDDGSVKSCSLSDLGFSEEVFICFSNASNAFLSYFVSIVILKSDNRMDT